VVGVHAALSGGLATLYGTGPRFPAEAQGSRQSMARGIQAGDAQSGPRRRPRQRPTGRATGAGQGSTTARHRTRPGRHERDCLVGADPPVLPVNGGWQPGDRAVELAKRQFQQARDRGEFEARLAANPEGSASSRRPRLPVAGLGRGLTSGRRKVWPAAPSCTAFIRRHYHWVDCAFPEVHPYFYMRIRIRPGRQADSAETY
jgi:hypothetical protein